MDQHETWHVCRPRSWLPLPKGHSPRNFRPMFIVAKRLDASRWHVAWRWASVQDVVDGDPAPPSQKRGNSPTRPIFGPFILWSNGWMHQDDTWYRGRPRPRPHCARWGPSSLPSPQKRHSPPSLIFGPCVLWPNGWMHHSTTWYGGRPLPIGDILLDVDPAPLP